MISNKFNFILFFICIILCCVNCENSTIECGRAEYLMKDCFIDLPPELNEYLSTKIPLNSTQILLKCRVFKKGIKCFNNYSKHCLTNESLILYQQSLQGAKHFENKLCEDKKFQYDFLKHKECFLHIKDDWHRCMKTFHNILIDELHPKEFKNSNEQFMQFCCSRLAYEKCVYNTAKYKCYKSSVKFVKDVARLLSDDQHYINCNRYENLLCAASTLSIPNIITIIILLKLFIISSTNNLETIK